MKSMPLIRLVTSDDDFKSLELPWNSLLTRSEANTIFLRWEWLFTWWNLFGKTLGQLSIIVVEEEGENIGIAPCYIKNERFPSVFTTRTLRFLGTGEDEAHEIDSEYLCIISAAGREGEIVQRVFDYVVSNALCDAIRFSKMSMDLKTTGMISPYCAEKGISCHLQPTSEVSLIQLPANWEDYLNSLTSAMRYEIRSDRRKLLKHGEVQFRCTNSVEELETDFEEMSRLHRVHWMANGKPGVFANQLFSLFHKTIMSILLKNGALQLGFLSLAGKNIGVGYHFLHNNKSIFYQTGFDRSSAPNVSVGLVTISHCIEQAIQLKCTEYDFLGGGHLYKKRLANQTRLLGEAYIPLTTMTQSLWSIRQAVSKARKKFIKVQDVIATSHPKD